MFKEVQQKISRIFFTKEKQRAFLEDICALVEDGVPAPQAVNVIYKSSTGLVREAAQSILTAISQGKRLADGMVGWFPRPIVEIIRNGEEGGSLASTMLAAAQALSEQMSVVTSIATHLSYPFVVFLIACGVAVFLKHYIFVSFASIKPISQWPDLGKNFIMLASFIEYWWWAVVIFVFILFFLIAEFLRNAVGETRKILDKIVPFSLYRNVVAARLMEILGLLISSGISFKDALLIIQRDSTRYMAWHIYMMQFRLSGGRENLADVLNTGLIGNDDIERLRAIAQSKSFELALIHLGNQAAKKNIQNLRRVSRICGGLLLALDAALAMFMIFSVYGVGIFIAQQ